jgi:hypothetical protein
MLIEVTDGCLPCSEGLHNPIPTLWALINDLLTFKFTMLFFEITSMLGFSKDLASLPSTQSVKEGVEKASSHSSLSINII